MARSGRCPLNPMSRAYSEDQLVEQPAIGLFATLGWRTVSAMEETFCAGHAAVVMGPGS
jgi:hypothetical protein